MLSIIISLPLNSLTEACNLNSFSLYFISTSTNDIYSEISLSLCFTIVSVNLFRSDSNRAVGTYSILQLFLVLCRAAETRRRQFQGSCWHNPQLPPRWNPWKNRLTVLQFGKGDRVFVCFLSHTCQLFSLLVNKLLYFCLNHTVWAQLYKVEN